MPLDGTVQLPAIIGSPHAATHIRNFLITLDDADKKIYKSDARYVVSGSISYPNTITLPAGIAGRHPNTYAVLDQSQKKILISEETPFRANFDAEVTCSPDNGRPSGLGTFGYYDIWAHGFSAVKSVAMGKNYIAINGTLNGTQRCYVRHLDGTAYKDFAIDSRHVIAFGYGTDVLYAYGPITTSVDPPPQQLRRGDVTRNPVVLTQMWQDARAPQNVIGMAAGAYVTLLTDTTIYSYSNSRYISFQSLAHGISGARDVCHLGAATLGILGAEMRIVTANVHLLTISDDIIKVPSGTLHLAGDAGYLTYDGTNIRMFRLRKGFSSFSSITGSRAAIYKGRIIYMSGSDLMEMSADGLTSAKVMTLSGSKSIAVSGDTLYQEDMSTPRIYRYNLVTKAKMTDITVVGLGYNFPIQDLLVTSNGTIYYRSGAEIDRKRPSDLYFKSYHTLAAAVPIFLVGDSIYKYADSGMSGYNSSRIWHKTGTTGITKVLYTDNHVYVAKNGWERQSNPGMLWVWPGVDSWVAGDKSTSHVFFYSTVTRNIRIGAQADRLDVAGHHLYVLSGDTISAYDLRDMQAATSLAIDITSPEYVITLAAGNTAPVSVASGPGTIDVIDGATDTAYRYTRTLLTPELVRGSVTVSGATRTATDRYIRDSILFKKAPYNTRSRKLSQIKKAAGVTKHGQSYYAVDSQTDMIYEYDDTLTYRSSHALASGNANPTGIVYHNGRLYVSNVTGAIYTIHEYDPVSYLRTATYTVPTAEPIRGLSSRGDWLVMLTDTAIYEYDLSILRKVCDVSVIGRAIHYQYGLYFVLLQASVMAVEPRGAVRASMGFGLVTTKSYAMTGDDTAIYVLDRNDMMYKYEYGSGDDASYDLRKVASDVIGMIGRTQNSAGRYIVTKIGMAADALRGLNLMQTGVISVSTHTKKDLSYIVYVATLIAAKSHSSYGKIMAGAMSITVDVLRDLNLMRSDAMSVSIYVKKDLSYVVYVATLIAAKSHSSYGKIMAGAISVAGITSDIKHYVRTIPVSVGVAGHNGIRLSLYVSVAHAITGDITHAKTFLLDAAHVMTARASRVAGYSRVIPGIINITGMIRNEGEHVIKAAYAISSAVSTIRSTIHMTADGIRLSYGVGQLSFLGQAVQADLAIGIDISKGFAKYIRERASVAGRVSSAAQYARKMLEDVRIVAGMMRTDPAIGVCVIFSHSAEECISVGITKESCVNTGIREE